MHKDYILCDTISINFHSLEVWHCYHLRYYDAQQDRLEHYGADQLVHYHLPFTNVLV